MYSIQTVCFQLQSKYFLLLIHHISTTIFFSYIDNRLYKKPDITLGAYWENISVCAVNTASTCLALLTTKIGGNG